MICCRIWRVCWQYRICDSEISQFRTLLPSHPIEVCSKSSVNYSSENFIHPILFSLGKKKHNAVRLTIPDNDSAWSEAFNVDTAGVSGQCSFSLLSAESEESIVYSYFVSISRAPGIFARSLVVSIFPLFTFVNNTTLPIKVMFVFCEMKRRFVLTLQGSRFWCFSLLLLFPITLIRATLSISCKSSPIPYRMAGLLASPFRPIASFFNCRLFLMIVKTQNHVSSSSSRTLPCVLPAC